MPLKSVEVDIVAEGLLHARARHAIEGHFVTSLALLSYNARFADPHPVGPFIRPNSDN
ncbi:hypothetical protein [Marinobacter sp. LV10R510-11A]|uniref:hypothetical protein n=1 Tax=Marinobacter sp. LV10R510-11A TaxID=1415568 RepID=UPI0012FD6F6D|nr:hypothetical protein [Marinobacter sp. LV10R510-11A]